MYLVACYAVYLLISIALTVWVARSLHRNGRVFLVEAFGGNAALADSVNHLLVVGFYLLNCGFVALRLESDFVPKDLPVAIELVSRKLGFVLLVLGVVHFVNVLIFNNMRKNAALDRSEPPVEPDATIDPVQG